MNERAVATVTLVSCIREVSGSKLRRVLGYHDVPEPLGHYRYLPNPLQFTIHPAFRSCTAILTDGPQITSS